MKNRKTLSSLFCVMILLLFLSNTVKADTINVDMLYKNAYQTTQKALTEKTQASVNEARKAIKALPAKLDWAIGEFSKKVDTVQQPILVNIVNSIKTAEKTPNQTNINKAKKAIPAELTPIWKNSYSAAVDKIQAGLQTKALNLVKTAESSKTSTAINNARIVVNDILTADSVGIRNWAKVLSNRLDAIKVIQTSELKVHYIDVGQADGILIENNGQFMLIDAGNNADADLVVNYLKSKGVSKLDYVIATHPHEDHIGGMDNVINTFSIGKIIMPNAVTTTKTYEDVLNAISNKGLKITAPKTGDKYTLGGASFTILAPNAAGYDNLNNYSVVIKLTYINNSFLFAGDAETISENEMINKGLDLKADVLKLGHHGSNTSTSQAFLDKVNPKYAVVSVGKDNSYGHPHKTVMDRLKAKGIKLYRTDESGTIVATTDGNIISFNVSEGSYDANGDGDNSNGGVTTGDIRIENVDLAGEIVTLKNYTNTDINMTGWKLVSVEGNQVFDFPSKYIFKANSTITIASGKATGTLKWTNSNIWNNSGDRAELYDSTNKLVSYK